MISAFGPMSAACAGRLPDIDAIVADTGALTEAYVEAVRRRQAGESFYGLLLTDEPVDRVLTALAPAVLAQAHGDDDRRATFDRIESGHLIMDGAPIAEFFDRPPILDDVTRIGAMEFVSLCPAMLIRSSHDGARLRALKAPPRPVERVVLEPAIPHAARARGTRPTVVVWAADRPGATIAYTAFALAEIHADRVLVTCDGRAPAGTRDPAYLPSDPRVAAALAAASCVVCVDPCDPGAAVAFARLGYGIAAPVTSGADEFVRGACVYDQRIFHSIYRAVTMAIGQTTSLLAPVPAVPPRPALPALPMARSDAPLVSIVVPTFNRRDDLAACLRCIGAQSYPSVEAVVVNDAGAAVADVVASFPFARLVDLETNGGVNRAMMRGLAETRGSYVQFLADDDRLFPDHVERLIAAMLAADAAVGHANVLIHYLESQPDGSIATIGYNAGIFNETTTPTRALVSTPIAGHALMWRRSVYDEIGIWREDCALADQEIQLRAAQRYAFVWVDQITAEWRIRGTENFSSKTNPLAEQERIYNDLHPVTDRPFVTQMREQALERLRQRRSGYVFEATIRVATPPGPAPAARS